MGAFFVMKKHIYVLGDEMKKLEGYIPIDIISEIKRYGRINEIRLKRRSRIVLKKDDRYIILDKVTDDRCFDLIVDNLLEHSYHSKLSELVEGFISLGDGYRVGVTGQAVIRDGTVTNISEIGSINIRIPYIIKNISEPVIRYMVKDRFNTGVLIYSPPGVGKTTLLRDIILTLCEPPYLKRIAVIDSRNEIFHQCMEEEPMIDLYPGYPKHKGIEQAIRTMAPDILICDELGNREETEAVLANQSAGVPIIATAHSDCYSNLMKRDNIKKMHLSGVFGCYIGIRRSSKSDKYEFEFNEREYVI